jgi:hypothetical protein
VISLPFCLQRQACYLNLGSCKSDKWYSPAPHQVPLDIQGLHPTHWRMSPFSGSNCLLVPAGITSPGGPGAAPWRQGRWQITGSTIPDEPPRNVAGISSSDRSHWGSLAGSNILLCRHRLRRLMSKPKPREQRGLTLYTLVSRLQKEKAKLTPHTATCDFIGYFIPPVLCDLFNVLIF